MLFPRKVTKWGPEPLGQQLFADGFHEVENICFTVENEGFGNPTKYTIPLVIDIYIYILITGGGIVVVIK